MSLMSFPTPDQCEKNDLSIPEILADFFLRKIDMPIHSDDSDHKRKHKRKKSKHKKRKHKKSKHRHRNHSSDSSSRGSDLNTKGVDDVSSSEEMGIQRLKKIKKMKVQSVSKTVLQTVSVTDDDPTKDKSDPSNFSTSENLVFYGPSLDLLLSGVEPKSSVSKVDTVVNASSDENLECDLNKTETTLKNDTNPLGRQNDNVKSSDLSVPLPVDRKVEPESIINTVPICDENNIAHDNNDANKNNLSPIKTSCNIQKESATEKVDVKKDYNNSEKCTNDIKQNDSHSVGKQKSDGKKKKHSRSRSRSKSHSKHNSPKPKYRKRTSRSSSKDSYHSHRKRKRHSHSQSHSQEKFKSRDHKKRSHSRSHSRSRYVKYKKNSRSQSPYERHNHRRPRSRSRSYTRHRRHSNSRIRRSHSRHREHSSCKSKYKSKSSRRSASYSRSRSKSKSQQKSHSKEKSRSKSKEKKSSQSNTKIDQAKILETARKNVLKMMKNGTLPDGLPVENLKKEQLISIQAGGKSVQELTDFCQRLSQKENEQNASDNEDKEDKLDDETGFIHHPFKVKEPGMIKLNIKNAVQLPIKTHAQKVAETARLSSQFPVSSGNQHKQKELEWIPVVPVSKNNETKPVETSVSTNADTNKTVETVPETPVLSAPPPISSIPMPVSYPSSSSEAPKVELPVVVSPLVPPPIPPSPLPPPLQPPSIQLPALFQMSIQPVMPSYVIPNQEMMNYASTSATVRPSASVFKPPKKLDIPSIVAKRFQALTKLKQYPNDLEALKVVHEIEESIQEWVESQQVPGLFTGTTDAKMLSVAELSGPNKYHKFRKDILSHAPPVTEGKGMSLLKKMGWNPGEGLGKNKEGSLEPLMLDFKMDKKGLVSEGENSKKLGVSSFTRELQGKHPVSALMELCSKRRWKPPLYTCVLDHGPPHKKLFCFKVEVNGVNYQPVNPCSNKKVAKADAAVLCLQSLNILPKTV